MTLAFALPSTAPWLDELWDTILDLSALLDDGTWVATGGQAVVAHALAARASADDVSQVDRLGRMVTVSAAVPKVTRTLAYLGFERERTPARATSEVLFRREAEGSGPDHAPQSWAVHIVGVTELLGGDQALARRVPFQVEKGRRSALVPVPDLLSTIVFEASRFAVDAADPLEHARNAAFLASLVEDPARERSRLTPTDRRALLALDTAVGSRDHQVWNAPTVRGSAFATWRRLLAE